MPESSIDLDVSPAEAWQRLSPAARRHVLVADLRAQGISDCGTVEPVGFSRGRRPTALRVFHQERRMTLARWPDHSFGNGARGDVPVHSGTDDVPWRPSTRARLSRKRRCRLRAGAAVNEVC